MNLPNKLTMLRVILIPFFVFALLNPGGIVPYSDYVALVIFIIASLTDMADGKIARKYGLVTDFGKFMDPLADKLLVCSAMICLIEMGRIPSWIVIIIVAREFAISGFRLIAADNGMGKIQDHLPDDHDHPDDPQHPAAAAADKYHHVGRPGSDHHLPL